MKVIFSKRAMTALLVETREKIATETGGVFLGKYVDGIWYVVETIDPGPKAIFKTAYFEYDQNYINHLINKISRLYNQQLDLVGLWHRHPGSLDSFSMTDDGTNSKYAELSSSGAISGLVNIDPKFRLTMYHVSLPLNYEKIEWMVDDELIPTEIQCLKENELLVEQIGTVSAKCKRVVKFADVFMNEKKRKAITNIHNYLKRRTISDVIVKDAKRFDGDIPVEILLEELESDFNFMEKTGIDYTIRIGEDGLLNLLIKEDDDSILLAFGLDNDTVVFVYNEITYKYISGLIEKAVTSERRILK